MTKPTSGPPSSSPSVSASVPPGASGSSHFDASGAAHMVSIDAKPEVARMARAAAAISMHASTLQLIESGRAGKGDVLGIARIAAISASKEAARLVPLCHPVRLTAVEVALTSDPTLPGVRIEVTVHAIDRTGPEMEAMVAASAAALTIYDMCKGIDRAMTIERVQLLEKSGGKSGHYLREG